MITTVFFRRDKKLVAFRGENGITITTVFLDEIKGCSFQVGELVSNVGFYCKCNIWVFAASLQSVTC